MKVAIRFSTKCSICEQEFVTEHGIYYASGVEVPRPYFERLWQWEGLTICPDHRVTLEITRKNDDPLVIREE